MYSIVMHKQAEKALDKMPVKDKRRISEKLYFLAYDPDDKNLDIKKLTNKCAYRLRVGDWRIIYERDDGLKIIAVEKIGSRGDVYK